MSLTTYPNLCYFPLLKHSNLTINKSNNIIFAYPLAYFKVLSCIPTVNLKNAKNGKDMTSKIVLVLLNYAGLY